MTQRMKLATVVLVLMSAVAACTAPPPPPPPPGDTVPPVLTGPGDLRLDTARTDGAVVTYLVEAFDAGDGTDVQVDCSPSSGELFPVGTTVVSCTAADAAGNVGELSFTVTVELLPGAVSVVAGSTHACALLDDGAVRCWGLNDQWQLGTADAAGNAATPVPVPGVQDAVALTAGSSHTCALIEGGTVTCWGADGGRLGHGVIAAFALPAPVAGLTDAVAVSAGDFHTCALLGDGTARCWGGNDEGQLGNGTTTTSGTPVAVSGLTGALSISAGGGHSCAVRASGLSRTVRCWGANDQGQLGNGTTTGSSVPVTVPGLTTTFVGAAAVAAGTISTCALLDDGTARCWGSNGYGQLGDGSFTSSSSPVEVNGLTAATSLDLRFINACATVAAGEIRCWGNNQLGQLGNGTTSPTQVPVQVTGISGAVDVSVGSGFACATLPTRAIACWGDNDFGRLGDGTGLDSSVPVGVVGIP
jgi:alpha-tubulin suppressor-like RCC1 family protein